jgi:DNA-binding response OmpR family regulator
VPDGGRPGSLSSRLSTATRLLLVEDEDDIAEFLRAYFRASGYDLVRIDPTSAQQVIAAIDEHQPECIMLDYGLRGFSGNEAYRLIRSADRFAFLPVIVVTADVTARAAAAQQATGIDGFVEKPFNVNSLAEMVSSRIESAKVLAPAGRDDEFSVMSQRYLDARINDELTVARHGGVPLAFALLRVEGGDDAVHEVIKLIRSTLTEHAVLGRTDSKELAVLVPDVAAIDLRDPLDRVLGELRPIGVAAGVASYPDHAQNADGLFMAADAALADAIGAGERVRVAI